MSRSDAASRSGVSGWLRGWRPAVSMAARNLRRNRVRTALAVLGVCIGVLAVAALGIFGNVLALGAADAIGDIGTQIVVSPNADAGVESLSDADVADIRRAVGGPAVVPLYSDNAIVSGQSDQQFATVYGVEEPGLAFEAAEGRLPERHRQGAIVGAGVAEDLSIGAGDTVGIAGRQVRVVAVLTERGPGPPGQGRVRVVVGLEGDVVVCQLASHDQLLQPRLAVLVAADAAVAHLQRQPHR